MKTRTHTQNLQKGQALLVLVLIIALAITVVSAVSYKLTTEIQTTKTQEENVRILAAADSGIEEGIRRANIPTAEYYDTYLNTANGLDQLVGIDPTRSTLTITNTSGTEFVSPELTANEQYTFYLWNYPATSGQDYYEGMLTIYFGSNGSGSCNSTRTTPAAEVTIISGPNNENVRKYLYEPCTSGQYIGGMGFINPTGGGSILFDNTTYNFNWKNPPLDISLIGEPKVVIVRSLFGGTRVGFVGSNPLPQQGRLIRSEAVSRSGSSKVVTLFQSLPQLPADFFVTTF